MLPASKLERKAVALPEGAWGKVPLTWAKDRHSGLLYTADADGKLFSLDEERGLQRSPGPDASGASRPDGRDA